VARPHSLHNAPPQLQTKIIVSLHLEDILKTLVANCALDKLKIEIAGNLNPAFPHTHPLKRTTPEVEQIFALTGSLCKD
jgi:hypothetical protein